MPHRWAGALVAPAEVLLGSIASRAAAMPGIVAAIRDLVRQFRHFFDEPDSPRERRHG